MKSSLTLIFLVLCSVCSAQDYVDLAKFFYANTPANQFDSTTAETRVQEYGMDVTLPVELKNGNAFLTGFYAESISTKVNPAEPNLTSVYSTMLKLGMNIKHSEKWSGTYLLLPKLASDFKSIDANDFQLGAIALLKYEKRKNLNYKVGLYYNSELFGPFFVPILGLYYLSPNEKLEINASLPISADINYKILERVRTGVSFASFVRTYYLNEPFQGNPDNYLTKSTNEVYGYLQFDLGKSIILQTKVGYSIGRNYRVYDRDDNITWGLSAFKFGDNRKQLNPDFKDGLVYRARLIYRFHLEK
ncbi:hypothetical protein Oweho_1716 [Owenweeksia hongkongensis DSM 17368]|uniref:DUF6268 domain-containing protein n=1 Tax=Owenweeksia hongkongensis (strain DSM 17368 / CIP 108786 / JCM 12287 / NRRL B-23963 / UST20020801) TaxID=926562 RepID=G8R0K0_OWEHD|nr:DUF6268 family outer membrane beta-barrel protein [Owenweeksia hongkongensis]AEV32704.1 hypothetical protein Oweho_1716 [Owenweeksia hongkongensis DSM 17368]